MDKLFSTLLYSGVAPANPVAAENVDFGTKGGMAWIKGRSGGYNHALLDTLRARSGGNAYGLNSASTTAENDSADISFRSKGYVLGSRSTVNANGQSYVAWNFLRSRGFFDALIYTGNGAPNQEIPHNLGGVPGLIVVKAYQADDGNGWYVFHKSLGFERFLYLNASEFGNSGQIVWGNKAPDARTFSVGPNASSTNVAGRKYIAYLFADDPRPSGIIRCGIVDAVDGGLELPVNLGWEAQFLLLKSTQRTPDSSLNPDLDSWYLFDRARKDGSYHRWLKANDAGAEQAPNPRFIPRSYGFDLGARYLRRGPHIFMAIRKGAA